jgi:integrase
MDYIDWNNNRIYIEPEKTKRYKKRVIIPLHSTLAEGDVDVNTRMKLTGQ